MPLVMGVEVPLGLAFGLSVPDPVELLMPSTLLGAEFSVTDLSSVELLLLISFSFLKGFLRNDMLAKVEVSRCRDVEASRYCGAELSSSQAVELSSLPGWRGWAPELKLFKGR